jgi:hypothetical protein
VGEERRASRTIAEAIALIVTKFIAVALKCTESSGITCQRPRIITEFNYARSCRFTRCLSSDVRRL